MTIEEAVITRLASLASVTALVSTRIYALKLPQGMVQSAIRVQAIDTNGRPHLRGGGGPQRSRVQVDAFAPERSGADPFAAAAALAEAINGDGSGNGLDGWAGTIAATLVVTGALRVDRMSGYDADELRLVRVRQDYMVGWKST